MSLRLWTKGVIAVCLCVAGCAKDTGSDEGEGPDDGPLVATTAEMTSAETTVASAETGVGSTGGTSVGSTSVPGAESSEGDDGPPILLDVGTMPDGGNGGGCLAPPQVHCDQMDNDPWHAIGLNCPGGPQVNGSVDYSAASQLYVHTGNLGTFVPPPFPPREGNKFVILSSGEAQDLTVAGLYASTDVGGFGSTPLPAPIQTNMVSATEDCFDNPGLVGSGDCSNTIQDQWDQGSGSYDYAEMRFTATVPGGTFGFTYDFAMFSTEYPVFYQTSFNDMYIAWLESENWTGNVSFDDMGHPISLNAGFLDYKDAPNPYDCPAPCQAPELQGTAMQGHAGTRWLTTTAGVVPGETIELVLGVFDLSDGILDTVVILDNFQWGCEGGAPVTIPG
ncbi:choice-of-anchor L domain-containing protein [Paraliomyxa miuraensis]|uniref:choice-of-anchor L domain-containing protein n=1 Tax=Paraliomyxa miuraensis TaxID=376150 RepID=UPI00225B338C|nr:choice-of-anchor L domain-containing protein [Paraliomyxa miuraensis]MCX4244947.1 choice-of-anchor L domain-containing protein [Paraliomyxa miuraensis]